LNEEICGEMACKNALHCNKKNVSHSEKKQKNAASIKRAGLQSNFLKIMEQWQLQHEKSF